MNTLDKYEYKVRVDEIKELISKGEYPQAAEIADTIDWRRVKSVMMLCIISDLYKINRRYEDARDILYLAYERRPGGKTICYSLCELCVKTEEFVQAVNFYKEFVQVAPKDPGRYILQYKIYEAQDVSLEERISVLEELKKKDYREKWAYELAYLYHRVGLATRCVEECDELILWFGEGKYVIKAMELKMLHEPLTAIQQEKYDHRFDARKQRMISAQEEPEVEESGSESAANVTEANLGFEAVENVEDGESAQSKAEPDDFEIHVKTVDVSEYNTINLQAELAEGLKEILARDLVNPAEQMKESNDIIPDNDTESLDFPQIDEVDESDLEPETEVMEETEVFFGETGDMSQIKTEIETKTETKTETETMFPSEPPKELANVLSQESDGQIRLVMPENQNSVEKQITGQMNIEDILIEWERMKKENEEKRKEEVRQHVLQHTGAMFTEFEAAVRDGLLEQLESGAKTVNPVTEEEKTPITEEAVPAEANICEEPLTDESVDDSVEELYDEPSPEVPEDMPTEETEAQEESIEEDDWFAEEELPEEELQEDEQREELASEETKEDEESKVVKEKSEEEAETTDVQESVADEEYDWFTEEKLPAEKIVSAKEQDAVAEEDDWFSEKEVFGEENADKTDDEEVAEKSETETGAAEERKATAKVRSLSKEEEELYGPFIRSRASKEKLMKAVDNVSLAAYTGNIVVTGEEGSEALALAKNMIRELQMTDSNFSGKVAKVSGRGLNAKNIEETLTHLNNGALIIEKASELKDTTIEKVHRYLQQENFGIVVTLVDTKKSITKLFDAYPELKDCFTARVDLEAMSNDMLVEAGKKYARELEYSIDDLGILAFHTRIDELQTSDHAVSVAEVKAIVDEAIDSANRKTPKHFFDILLGRRYDEEDMIILTEKDFV